MYIQKNFNFIVILNLIIFFILGCHSVDIKKSDIYKVDALFYLNKINKNSFTTASIESAYLSKKERNFQFDLNKDENQKLFLILKNIDSVKNESIKNFAYDLLPLFFLKVNLRETNSSFKIIFLEKNYFFINRPIGYLSFKSPELKEFLIELFKKHCPDKLYLLEN